MALASKQCSVLLPCSPAVIKPAKAGGNRLVCTAALPAHKTNRRESLGFLLALPLVLATPPAHALDLFDNRIAKTGLDSLDQARSDVEDYRNRFSFQGGSSNLSLDDHKQRAKESFKRLQQDIKKAVDDKAYPRVSADLRHQLGTLSFDLKKVAQSQGSKEARKQSQQLQKQALDALANLDFYARKKNGARVQESYAEAVKALGDVVSSLG